MYKMGISNTMSYRQGLGFLLLSLFVYLVALGLICSGLSCGNGMALKLPVLRLAFLTLPLHYAHILPEPHSLCPKACFSNSGGSSEHPARRLRSVECWASKTEIKKMQESFWMVEGLCPKKMKTWAFQEHGSLSECFLCYVLAEVCRQSSVKNNFLYSFQPACQFCGERVGFQWGAVKFGWVLYLCRNV